jgi:NADH:ubiquinone oxidoreductase subunit K
MPTDFPPLNQQLLLGGLLFATAAFGFAARRGTQGAVIAVAGMHLAATAVLAAFGAWHGDSGGSALALAALAVGVIEAAVVARMAPGRTTGTDHGTPPETQAP